MILFKFIKSAIEAQRIAHLSIWKRIDFENLAKCVLVKASKHKFISKSALSKKQKHPNYKSHSFFQVDGKSVESEEHHSNLRKDDVRVKYFEPLDLIMASIRSRFDQSSFVVFFHIWNF